MGTACLCFSVGGGVCPGLEDPLQHGAFTCLAGWGFQMGTALTRGLGSSPCGPFCGVLGLPHRILAGFQE